MMFRTYLLSTLLLVKWPCLAGMSADTADNAVGHVNNVHPFPFRDATSADATDVRICHRQRQRQRQRRIGGEHGVLLNYGLPGRSATRCQGYRQHAKHQCFETSSPLQLRGGGLEPTANPATGTAVNVRAGAKATSVVAPGSTKSSTIIRQVSKFTAVAASVGLLWHFRARIVAALSFFGSEKFKADLLRVLNSVDDMGIAGLVIYTICFAMWEASSMPTAPIETVAGMAFGLPKALIVNAMGKCSVYSSKSHAMAFFPTALGAILTVVVGRYLILDAVKKKFGDSEILVLAETSSSKRPMKVSLIMRFAPLPELIKLLGLSLLPIDLGTVAFAILLHGLPFTFVWSAVGAEAGAKLNGAPGIFPHSAQITRALTVATVIFGIFGSPGIFGAWIAELRREHLARTNQ